MKSVCRTHVSSRHSGRCGKEKGRGGWVYSTCPPKTLKINKLNMFINYKYTDLLLAVKAQFIAFVDRHVSLSYSAVQQCTDGTHYRVFTDRTYAASRVRHRRWRQRGAAWQWSKNLTSWEVQGRSWASSCSNQNLKPSILHPNNRAYQRAGSLRPSSCSPRGKSKLGWSDIRLRLLRRRNRSSTKLPQPRNSCNPPLPRRFRSEKCLGSAPSRNPWVLGPSSRCCTLGRPDMMNVHSHTPC